MLGSVCFFFTFKNDDDAVVFVNDFLLGVLFTNDSTFLSFGLDVLSGELEIPGAVDCDEANVPAVAPAAATVPMGRMPLTEGTNPGVVVVVEWAIPTPVGSRCDDVLMPPADAAAAANALAAASLSLFFYDFPVPVDFSVLSSFRHPSSSSSVH